MYMYSVVIYNVHIYQVKHFTNERGCKDLLNYELGWLRYHP